MKKAKKAEQKLALQKRRRIEEHQAAQREKLSDLMDPMTIYTSNTIFSDVTSPGEEAWDDNLGDQDQTEDPPPEPKERTEEEPDEHEALYVYDSEDFTLISLDEIKLIWRLRHKLCLTVEAAAEALALLEADAGLVEYYQGWQNYLNRPEIEEFQQFLSTNHPPKHEDPSKPSITLLLDKEKNELTQLKRQDVSKKSTKELKQLWEKRDQSFASIEAACECLAQIRYATQIDDQLKPWQTFTSHPEIEKLKNHIPDRDYENTDEPTLSDNDTNTDTPTQVEEYDVLEMLSSDMRVKMAREQYIRDGQNSFRKMTLHKFGYKCCITGCKEESVLEAAHIIPYHGPHSNSIENSLCLRVDIHRLFDRYLISINPSTNKIVLSTRLKNSEEYASIDGKSLLTNLSGTSLTAIKKHFDTFLKIHKINS